MKKLVIFSLLFFLSNGLCAMEDGGGIPKPATRGALNPNGFLPSFTTILFEVCRGRDDEDSAYLAELLLKAGADPDYQDRISSMTPLHMAAVTGKFACAEVLLRHGADPNLCDWFKQRPLYAATMNVVADGFVKRKMVRILLTHGASRDRIPQEEWRFYSPEMQRLIEVEGAAIHASESRL